MTSLLVLCSGCSRHFRATEAACPFCGADGGAAARPRARERLPAGAARSRRYAVRAAFLAGSATAACSGSTSGTSSSDAGSGVDAANTATGGSGQGGAHVGAGGARTGAGGGGAAGASSGGVRAAGGASAAGGSSASGAGNGGVGGGLTCDGAQNRTGVPLCRSSTDCVAPKTCYMTEPPRGCGNPNFQPQLCQVDGDCPDSGICEAISCGGHVCTAGCDPATCNGAASCVAGKCVAKACDADGGASCGPDAECKPGATGADARGCVLIHCSATRPCPENQDCSAALSGKGCVQRTCTKDAECDCGYCVNSRCEATLGFCYEILAMPYGCVWPDEELV